MADWRLFTHRGFCFLDEIWKSSPAILNNLLTIINEHLFKNGSDRIDVPLKSLIAASNEIPEENQGLEALYDRFIVRMLVPPIQNNATFNQLLNSKPSAENCISIKIWLLAITKCSNGGSKFKKCNSAKKPLRRFNKFASGWTKQSKRKRKSV